MSALVVSCDLTDNQEEKTAQSQNVEVEKPVSKDPIVTLNEKIKEDPNDGSLYLERAAIKRDRDDYQGALYDIDRALRTDSLDGSYLMFKADLFKLSGQRARHKKYLEEILEKNPEVLDAYYELGYLYLVAENYKKAYDLANSALKIDVNYAPSYFLKGMAYKDEENYKMAVSSFQTAIEQDVEYYDGYVELGLLYALAEDDLALAYYDNAIAIDSTRIDALYNKGMYLQNKGEYREALHCYEAIIKHNPNFSNAYFNRGFVYLEYLEDNDSAAFNFGHSIRLSQNNYKAYYNRGLAHERNLEYTLADNDYRKALSIQPDFDLAAKGVSRIEEKSK